jgi:hypothetical protein
MAINNKPSAITIGVKIVPEMLIYANWPCNNRMLPTATNVRPMNHNPMRKRRMHACSVEVACADAYSSTLLRALLAFPLLAEDRTSEMKRPQPSLDDFVMTAFGPSATQAPKEYPIAPNAGSVPTIRLRPSPPQACASLKLVKNMCHAR